jgi:hypothetical protein
MLTMKGLNVFILKLIGKLHCKQVTEEDRRQKGMFTCAFSLKKTTALKLSDLESQNPPSTPDDPQLPSCSPVSSSSEAVWQAKLGLQRSVCSQLSLSLLLS